MPTLEFITEIKILKARIKELELGSCRFNCRKAKDVAVYFYRVGFSDGQLLPNTLASESSLEGPALALYKEWCE